MADTEHHTGAAAHAGIPTQAIRDLTEGIGRLDRRFSMWVSFRNGIVAGIGSTLGVFLVLSLLVWILGLFDFIPAVSELQRIIGNFLNNPRS